jgi:hypothetical protein
MRHPTEHELRQRHAARSAQLEEREVGAWKEYLAGTKSGDALHYEQNEPFAWRRLKRMLAELAADRRRADFELDRGLAEARGITRAS